MKLSEAIRLGALLGPQVFNNFFEDDGSCALGSVALAMRIKELPNRSTIPLSLKFRLLNASVCFECPCVENSVGYLYYGGSLRLHTAIAHLDDTHKWTRERIADWVETIEDELPVKQEIKITDEEKVCA